MPGTFGPSAGLLYAVVAPVLPAAILWIATSHRPRRGEPGGAETERSASRTRSAR